MYGVFVKQLFHTSDANNTKFYPMYQDVNVMMLIGFGFLMTFIKNNSWSAVSYSFLINAIVVQLYLLLSPFWHKVFKGHWEDKIVIV
jgi:ammonium transporter Rh